MSVVARGVDANTSFADTNVGPVAWGVYVDTAFVAHVDVGAVVAGGVDVHSTFAHCNGSAFVLCQ
ncbi:hypothetical protein SGI37_20210, partial [Providencia rettgeri]